MSELALIIGRLVFGGYFAFSGLNHFMNSEQMSGWLESQGIPQPDLLTYFTGGQLIFGGALVALAFEPVIGIGALSLFLLVVTPLMHDFWNMEGGERQNHQVNFLKNAALLGALLVMLGAQEAVFSAPLV